MSPLSPRHRASRPFFYIRIALRLRVPLAIATMVFAVAGLVTNLANVGPLLNPLGDRSATHPVTALCLFGLGLGIVRMRRFSKSPPWRVLIALTIVSTCVARLIGGAFGLSTQATTGTLFGPSIIVHGRFSIEAAITLGSFAVAAMLRRGRGPSGTIFLLIGLATVFNTLLELSYGLTFFNGDVGVCTILGMVCAALSMVTVYIHRPMVRVPLLLGDLGAQTRVMALTAVGVPWVCGFCLYYFNDLRDGDTFAAAMISVIIWSMLIILLITSARHEVSDSARRRAEREIAMLGRTDTLTAALNRFGMTEALNHAWDTFQAGGAKFGMILIDLDHFKQINDTFGHVAGDDVLARVTAALRPHLRVTDALGRWGGEEFLILLQIQDRANLECVAERLRDALDGLDSPYLQSEQGVVRKVSASFGISDMRADDSGPADAITRADAGLYQAKEAGRNCVVSHYDLVAA